MPSNPDATESAIQRINPPSILDARAHGFSQVVTVSSPGKTVYISGQFSGNPAGQVLGASMEEQMTIAFNNLRLAIAAAGAQPAQVVKIQVLVVDHEQKYLAHLSAEISKLFGQHLPASTLIPVPRLALDGMRFEIDATLFVPG